MSCAFTLCTKRHSPNSGYCINHYKQKKENKLEVFAETINGIPHYVDIDLNVWKAEDIKNKSPTPRKIGTAILSENGAYRIELLSVDK